MATILLDNLSALFKRLKAWKALHKSVQWNTNCWKATNKTAGISKQDFFSFVACFIIGLRMFNRFRLLRKNGLSAKKRTLKCCCEVTWPRLRTYYVLRSYEDPSDDNEFLSSVISSRWQRLAWTQVLPIIGPHRYATFPYEEDEGKEASWSEDVKPKTCSNYYAKFSIVLNGVDTIRTRDTHTNLEGQAVLLW